MAKNSRKPKMKRQSKHFSSEKQKTNISEKISQDGERKHLKNLSEKQKTTNASEKVLQDDERKNLKHFSSEKQKTTNVLEKISQDVERKYNFPSKKQKTTNIPEKISQGNESKHFSSKKQKTTNVPEKISQGDESKNFSSEKQKTTNVPGKISQGDESKHFSSEKQKTTNVLEKISQGDESKHFSSEIQKTTNVPEKIAQDHPERIMDYFNLCTKFESYIAEHRNSWKVTLEEYLVFYKVNVSDHPRIVASIKIDKNLKVQVFTENREVKGKYLKVILNEQLVLVYWSQLKKLLMHFETGNLQRHVSIKYNLSQALKYLKECLENKSLVKNNTSLKPKLKFIFSQMYALAHNKYTDDIIFLAYSIYLKSSSTYRYLERVNCIILPREEDLVKYVHKDKIEEKI